MRMLFRHRLSLQGDRRWLSGPMHGLQEYPVWDDAGVGRERSESRSGFRRRRRFRGSVSAPRSRPVRVVRDQHVRGIEQVQQLGHRRLPSEVSARRAQPRAHGLRVGLLAGHTRDDEHEHLGIVQKRRASSGSTRAASGAWETCRWHSGLITTSLRVASDVGHGSRGAFARCRRPRSRRSKSSERRDRSPVLGRFTACTWSGGASSACTRSRNVCAAWTCELCSTLCVSRSPQYSPSWLKRWKPTRRRAPDR